MDVNLSLLIAVVALVVSVLLTTVIWLLGRRKLTQLSSELLHHQQQLSSMKKQLSITASTLEEVQARSIVVAKNTESTAAALADLHKQLTTLGEQDPESKVYQRAAAMLQSGASIDEVIHSCDLPEAEVQLLLKIHHPATGG
ncbi:DUF2802 domain-containing protein [Alteromonas lipolytica]|uniref:DUF2802 domain-containing protein n=1 Tax=Alteromonas lipolytica TaxID=1856405 RepID=A0A1E8FFD1_9ALTE|nr:DUF2802 domain-containing protein [Alteromonas lipolytica]OFI34634.1 hypothetical protein BFC17_13645 [Alteromonas lipolytica]GGF52724.1 hypothetical protein GCM10011338_01050 [Alteromonas lipolytica]